MLSLQQAKPNHPCARFPALSLLPLLPLTSLSTETKPSWYPMHARWHTASAWTTQSCMQGSFLFYAACYATLCYIALCHAAKACTASREEGVPCLRAKGDAQALTCGPAALPTQRANTCVWRCGAAGKRRLSSPPIHTHTHMMSAQQQESHVHCADLGQTGVTL